jgi:hypothetical protein
LENSNESSSEQSLSTNNNQSTKGGVTMNSKKEELLERLENEFYVSLGYEDWCHQSDHGERYTWLSDNSTLVPYSDRFRDCLYKIEKEIEEEYGIVVTKDIRKKFTSLYDEVDELDGERYQHFNKACELDSEIESLLEDMEKRIYDIIVKEAEENQGGDL